jgi:4-diphosphocytidyl-2-C-methyl-D-erythritol kinase
MSQVSRSALVLRAPAKVNLTLEVVGRRPDGYHDICTVMQAITLADELSLRPAPELSLRCSRPELETPDNLVWRAAMLVRRETGATQGAAIFLDKRIPIAAGLGGGSSDAAAALRGLNELWGLGLGPAQLMELAARIGSDVPFFLLRGGCALAEGRGERLTELPPLPPHWLVLVKPPIGISAGAVYGAFPRERWSDCTRTRAWLAQVRQLGAGRLPDPFNDLEEIALQVAPEAARARDALLAAGAPRPVMAGSGSTFFAVFESRAEAMAAYRRVPAGGGQDAYLAAFAEPATEPEPPGTRGSGPARAGDPGRTVTR